MTTYVKTLLLLVFGLAVLTGAASAEDLPPAIAAPGMTAVATFHAEGAQI
jgi:hypothetical protein